MSHAQPLSSLESAFLGLESRDVPFVFACILELDQPVGLDALRAHVDAALRGVPRYRQRIIRGRLGTASREDDDDFRIEHQIFAAWAPPTGARALDDLAAELLRTELALDHPPWRLWTVDGLPDGRGAIIALVHHASSTESPACDCSSTSGVAARLWPACADACSLPRSAAWCQAEPSRHCAARDGLRPPQTASTRTGPTHARYASPAFHCGHREIEQRSGHERRRAGERRRALHRYPIDL
jgi:hypothetical protein